MITNKILVFSAITAALSLIGAIGSNTNAYAILSYTFVYLIESHGQIAYTYLCTGYYYPGDKYFRQVNCNPSTFNIVYYYCNQYILYNDGYGHTFWGINQYCAHVAPIKPGPTPPLALPSQLPKIGQNQNQQGNNNQQ